MLKKILVICLLCGSIATRAMAQEADSVSQVIYLIGNTAAKTIPEANLAAFRNEVQAQQSPFTIVHLGDVASNRGLGRKPEIAATRKLNKLLHLTDNTKGRFYFVPGDKDWDNSGKEGLEDVKRLGKYISDHNKNGQLLIPEAGCPGPVIKDIGTTLRIIAINTQWWMHPYYKPQEPDTDCGILSGPEFTETLVEAIEEAKGRQIIIVGHHPVLSNGVYGGHMPLKKHLFPLTDINPLLRVPLPVLGSFYAAYRQNVGTARDMANPDYQNFVANMNRLFKTNDQLIYAAAHDYSMQLNAFEDNYHLVSGSFTEKDYVSKNPESLVNRAANGFAKVVIYKNGKVTNTFYEFAGPKAVVIAENTLFQSACTTNPNKNIPVNKQVGPCVETEVPAPVTTEEVTTIGNKARVVAGPQYQAVGLKRKVFGDLYRASWTQPIQVPLLYLSRTKDRLRPLTVGGGQQTISLRLRATEGRQFVFRSVDKDPVGALPPELRNTVAKEVIRQITPTQQPYGALVVSSLLDSTTILHAQPKLFVLADDPALGAFRANYTDLLGMLEEHPVDLGRNTPNFKGATDIKDTYNLFRQLYKDHNNQVDAQEFGRARAFDIFIGDWDRHPDNWGWAGFKTDSLTVYRPIPRDRDHAFSRWDGIIPWLADRKWAIPNIQGFDTELSGLRSLTWSSRHLDRFLLTSLTRQDWLIIAEYLQTTFTDPVIDKAIAELPEEVAATQGQEIYATLKKRRQHLPTVLQEYYELLARYVDVVASNKNEYFEVQRQPTGNVQVQVFRREKSGTVHKERPLYSRTFLNSETKEIRLYGLGGEDVFDVSGETSNSIRIRIIGGNDQDSISDVSEVKGLTKKTVVYDNTATALQLSKETRNLTSDAQDINYYSPTSFEYNAVSPNGSLIYNESDGIGLSFGVAYKRQRFRKKEYSSLYTFNVRATQFGNLQLTTNLLWRHVLGMWDVGTRLDLGRYFRTYDFFGLGNNTLKNEQLYEDKVYKARYGGIMSSVYLQRQFFQKSVFRFGPLFETLTTDFKNNSILGQPENLPQPVNTTNQHLIGGAAEFLLDLRDKLIFTQRGLRLFLRHNAYKQLKSNGKAFGITEGFVDYYVTGRVLLPATLALRLGGAKNFGQDLPYYKYTTLGMRPNLRGYVINRFTGDASLYFNSELRMHLGEVETAFLPFRYGAVAFFDRGRVWYQGGSAGGWHDGYGGGFYIAPIAERFTFSMILQHSREEPLLFSFGAGFRFDQ